MRNVYIELLKKEASVNALLELLSNLKVVPYDENGLHFGIEILNVSFSQVKRFTERMSKIPSDG
jgi:hypothetical protein